MVKAVKQNHDAGKSSSWWKYFDTAKVIRLSRDGKSRSYFEKIIELVLATNIRISVF